MPAQFDAHVSRAADSDEQAISEETSVLYQRAWELVRSEFTDRDQLIFSRIVQSGEQPRHVAEDTALARNNVYQIVARIKKRLRERFQGELDC